MVGSIRIHWSIDIIIGSCKVRVPENGLKISRTRLNRFDEFVSLIISLKAIKKSSQKDQFVWLYKIKIPEYYTPESWINSKMKIWLMTRLPYLFKLWNTQKQKHFSRLKRLKALRHFARTDVTTRYSAATYCYNCFAVPSP